MKILLTILFMTVGIANYANDTLVVFDGGSKKEGQAWAQPRGIATMELSPQHPYSNDYHLSYNVKLQAGWSGAGWNWCAWKGQGTDVSGYKYVVFRLGLSKAKIKDLYIRLTSYNGKGKVEGMGPKVMILPLLKERNKYIRIQVPLKDLSGDTLDLKHVWGINFEVYGNNPSGSAKIFVDQIEFTN